MGTAENHDLSGAVSQWSWRYNLRDRFAWTTQHSLPMQGRNLWNGPLRMYSILPFVVAILFLAYSVYVLHSKGLTRVTTAFAILCVTTFFWQATWAVLFQVDDPQLAAVLARLGWLLILFLPTSLYQFLAEVTGRQEELRKVYASYGFALLLAILLVTTDLVVDGYYEYFWGYYPRAGVLHPLHVLQTAVVVMRGLYITFQKQQVVQGGEKIKLRYCIASLLIYFLAASDYLCNYGFEFYPPGVVFIAISLGIMALATSRYHVMDDSRLLAASVAHEMRTPLATIRLQSQALGNYLPALVQGYQLAESHNLVDRPIPQDVFNQLSDLSNKIDGQVSLATQAIDMLLALVSAQNLSPKDFKPCSAKDAAELAMQQISKAACVHRAGSSLGFHDIRLSGLSRFCADKSDEEFARSFEGSRGWAHRCRRRE